ncbi:hypothetical protein EPO15_02245 [bacterium]|nr:MAG: hypothetical protein EPO15_02245 [bacterium]
MPLPPELESSGLPPAFLAPLQACFDGGQPGRVLAAVRADPRAAAEALSAAFGAASDLTGLSPAELVARSGLGAGDVRGRRVDAAVAELRAVGFLAGLGFRKVQALGPDDTRQRADLVAERAGERWAVDARCASRDLLPEGSFRRGPDGKALPYPTLHDYLVHCYHDKAGQLARTMADERCSRSAVVVALDGASGALMRSEALRAWLSCGGPAEFRFGLMPGLLAGPSPDDSIVPAP